MSGHIPSPNASREEVYHLASVVLSNEISDADLRRFEDIITLDPAARDWYVEFMCDAYNLRTNLRLGRRHTTAVPPMDDRIEGNVDAPQQAAVPVVTSFFSTSMGCFSSGWPVAYLMATIVFGLGLLIGSHIYVSRHERVVDVASPIGAEYRLEPQPKAEIVGRITGVVDCQWAKNSDPLVDSDVVSLGHEFKLESGLVEIGYNSGAKVILQGPVAYVVESRNGGFMSVGKLTGKVTTASAKGFSVRTPTATVTDLGTEFGVEVNKQGITTSHVFRGRVELRFVGGGNDDGNAIQLGENESARLEPGQNRAATVIRQVANPAMFSRKIPVRVPIKLFNTGVGLNVGESDLHWQIVAISDTRDFQPCPALVCGGEWWLTNDPKQSQWITSKGEARNDVKSTFRTTFDLTQLLPRTATLSVRFIADNLVSAIRINGKTVREYPGCWNNYTSFNRLPITSGFVEGINTLEIEVYNGGPGEMTGNGPMGLRVELSGSAYEK
jgi:hypothetical protein